jgi:GxxExxY protein
MSRNTKLIKTPFDELTHTIIGCAMATHNSLGPGLRENTYQRDLEARLLEKELPFVAQKHYDVLGGAEKDVLIGFYIPDFIVSEKIVVEIKALSGINNDHISQVIGYLAVTGCHLGMLINFGERRLNFRRILPPLAVQEHQVNRRWLYVPEWLKRGEEENN